MKKLYTIGLLLLTVTGLHATHLLGGYITYRHIANQLYEIKLILYRDCNSATPFDGAPGATVNAVVGIFEKGGPMYTTIELTNPQISLVRIYESACISQPNFCMEQGVYTTTFNLPNPAKAYTVVYERCCFGGLISNVVNSGNAGIAFTATLPALNTGTNSCPVFDSIPTGYVVVNDTLRYNYHATDVDGDSLVYSFGNLNAAGDASSPAPNPPAGPPYTTVNWANGYSANNIFGNSGLSIDSGTGWVSGLSAQVGGYIAGIVVHEYRNGQLLNSNTRMAVFWVDGCFPNGIEENEDVQLHIFPNPASKQLFIQLPDLLPEEATGQIVDITGRLLHKFTVNGTTTDLTTQDLPPGYYNVIITTAKGKTAAKRFVRMAD